MKSARSSMQALRQLSEQAGIAVRWRDAFGQDQEVAPDSLRQLLRALELPCDSAGQIQDSRRRLAEPARPVLVTAVAGKPLRIPGGLKGQRADYELRREDGSIEHGRAGAGHGGDWRLPPLTSPGYHQLQIGHRQVTLAVAPPRCWLPVESGARHEGVQSKLWGLAAQVYGLRRAGDGGLGDYAALAQLATAAGKRGADALAISPVHAMFSSAPQRCSPYSPSSRLFLNAFLAPAGPARSSALQRRLEREKFIDWPDAAALRMRQLRALWQKQRRDPAFLEFRRQGGELLAGHATYEALAGVHGPDWRQWPAALREAGAAAVQKAASPHADEVEFHAHLQWQAHRGLVAAQSAAQDAGMRIGLIADFAVGCDPGGSEAWSGQAQMLRAVSIGAPPDLINRQGQGWGLAAFSPRGLQEQGYARFIACLRAALRSAGGLRIDHVMGLMRLWLVPDGAPAAAGAYLRYPLHDLLRLIQLESWRHRALIIGEDLGTVPEGFREQLHAAGILGMRVLAFERDGRRFRQPRDWDRDCVAFTSTHDLPTLAGWAAGRDIRWRRRLGFIAETRAEQAELRQRAGELRELRAALRKACVPPGTTVEQSLQFVGRSACRLALLPLEDALALPEQPNLPGSVEVHPNWQRRYPAAAERLLDGARARRNLELFARARQA